MKSFAAMLFGSLALAALFFAFVLLSNARGMLSERSRPPLGNSADARARSESTLRAKPIHYLCPDRYHGGPVPATKWNVTHLVCIRVRP